MKTIKIVIAVFCLFFALLFSWVLCNNFNFSSDLPIAIAICWLAGISWFLIAKRNLSLSKSGRSFFLLNFGLCGVFLLVIGIPNFIQACAISAANPCINNLRQIDAAANEFALEHNLTNGSPINFPNDLTPYIKLNNAGKIPGCPQGGVYHISKVGEAPTCSLGTTVTPAHVLP